ncbi:MAG: TonB family protein [Acidobacteriales bacterium]|nr:TonB family protein [Terriglobales bacterium]
MSSWQVQPSSEATADADLQRSFSNDVEQTGRLIRQVTIGESAAVGSLPAALREVVEHSIPADPLQRWTAQDVRKFLEQGTRPAISRPASPQPAVTNMTAPPAARLVYDSVGNARSAPAEELPEQIDAPASKRRRFVIPAVLTVIVGAGIALTPHMLSRKNASAPERPPAQNETVQAPPQSSSAAAPSSDSAPPSSAVKPAEKAESAAPSAAQDGVVSRAMPEVSESALRTITGKINVSVKVRVNPAGEVEQALLVSPGPSRYFAEKAQSAARQWKFAPQAEGQGRAFMLRFTFRRSGVESTAKNS